MRKLVRISKVDDGSVDLFTRIVAQVCVERAYLGFPGDSLENVWIEEGDIATFIKDSKQCGYNVTITLR